MSKQTTITLRSAEVGLLLNLLLDLKEKGEYWGRKDHFYKRRDELIAKLEASEVWL